jgi:hypothetical protein
VLCCAELLESLKQPPDELLRLASGEEQSDDGDSDDTSDDSAETPPTATASTSRSSKQPVKATTATGVRAEQSTDSGGWPLLKELRQQLQQHLRRQQHLQLAAVAPQLSKLRNTAIPLPADDLTDDMLPPLPLKSALARYAASNTVSSTAGAVLEGSAGASVLMSATGQVSTAAAEDPAASASSGSNSSSSWLCIAAFDKQVAVLPTKTRPKRLLMLASDGSIHAFLLKGRDDLRVDERLMQLMRASNALLATGDACAGAAAGSAGQSPASAAAAAAAGWYGGRRNAPLRMRPYSITPFGRRAGLVQWVRHTTSLFGLFRSWQQCAAERYQAVAGAKRDAAAAAAAAAAGGAQGDRTGDKQLPAGASAGAKGAADGGSAAVPLPLIVAASRPTDAFYARLLPALQAAGLPVGSARSSWPASKCAVCCCCSLHDDRLLLHAFSAQFPFHGAVLRCDHRRTQLAGGSRSPALCLCAAFACVYLQVYCAVRLRHWCVRLPRPCWPVSCCLGLLSQEAGGPASRPSQRLQLQAASSAGCSDWVTDTWTTCCWTGGAVLELVYPAALAVQLALCACRGCAWCLATAFWSSCISAWL